MRRGPKRLKGNALTKGPAPTSPRTNEQWLFAAAALGMAAL
jgi:MYXO-CTERM domain-containing protein